MKQSPKIYKRVSTTTPFALLGQKVLPCIWEVLEGITAEEFQEFIHGPNGVNFGLGAWMNICKGIDLELAGNPPYARKF